MLTSTLLHYQVWFRRGVNSHNPCGSGWISMVGEMFMINVGLNDQVIFLRELAQNYEEKQPCLIPPSHPVAVLCRCWLLAVRIGLCTSARV